MINPLDNLSFAEICRAGLNREEGDEMTGDTLYRALLLFNFILAERSSEKIGNRLNIGM